jgi:hypothetical protein
LLERLEHLISQEFDMNKTQEVLRGRLAAAVRYNHDDADRLRAELKASRAEDYLVSFLESPTPTIEARMRLASLLVGGTA